MADPFSVAASVAGLLSLGIQVSQSLVDYYSSYRSQSIDIERTSNKLTDLLMLFESLGSVLQKRTFRTDERALVQKIESSINSCEDLIHELQGELMRCDKSKIEGFRAVGRRLAYPFKQSTLTKIDENINDIRENLSLAIDVLQLSDSNQAIDDIESVKSMLALVRGSQLSNHIHSWLKAPDATINHNEACAKRHPNTGTWLVNGPDYRTWLEKPNSFLWITGFAGTGKSVLCSTAIQYAFRHRRSNPRIGIAFFYFSFNDSLKQDLSSMLRALILQLSTQLPSQDLDLVRLHERYQDSTPPTQAFLETLQSLINKFQDVYIIIDALDESPGEARDAVLQAMIEFPKWSIKGLHTLVTSRDLPDVREVIQDIGEVVAMENAGVDHDIANFISDYLQGSLALRKWSEHHQRIKEVLTDMAKGVFRWVECQFKSLAQCPRSELALERRLASLPKSLNGTYERILLSIDSDSVEDARRILTVLCYAERPLTVPEVIDSVAVELGEDQKFNLKRRFQDENDILRICPGLINLSLRPKSEARPTDKLKPEPEVQAYEKTLQIAHASVQQYLESDQILQSKVLQFGMKPIEEQVKLGQICLVYLLDSVLLTPNLSKAILDQRPLAEYAARYWYEHYRNAKQICSEIDDLALELTASQENGLLNWIRICDPELDSEVECFDLGRTWETVANPIYYASYIGLTSLLSRLLTPESALDFPRTYGEVKVWSIPEMINATGGLYGCALQAASVWGHKEIVQLLVDRGAKVNAEEEPYGYALQAASLEGHKEIVQFLLDKGAYVNAKGGPYGNALQAALLDNHKEIVQLLLEKGANVNAQGGSHCTPLQTASRNGDTEVVQLLLDRGAHVDTHGGHFGSALQAASFRGHTEVVQLLLDYGANADAQGGGYGNALRAASCKGHKEVVQLLLEKVANVDARGSNYGTALEIAAKRHYTEVVQLLLDKGAKVKGNFLRIPSVASCEDVVQLLRNYHVASRQSDELNFALA